MGADFIGIGCRVESESHAELHRNGVPSCVGILIQITNFYEYKNRMHGTSDQLVVLLHGCGGDSRPSDFAQVLAYIRTTLPDAAILAPHFNRDWQSNVDPLSIANELENMLDIFYDKRPAGCFNKLILISHSVI